MISQNKTPDEIESQNTDIQKHDKQDETPKIPNFPSLAKQVEERALARLPNRSVDDSRTFRALL